jgi:crotonobetainyl-CoA:carnitine CoA-transferase CaiB-like acyl-CoA transferase
MKNNISKEEWVAMYREIGLDHSKMEQWHKLFESRHAQGHQSFLEWLGVPPNEIDQIRAQSR